MKDPYFEKIKVLVDADVVLECLVNRSGYEDAERLLVEMTPFLYVTDKCLDKIHSYGQTIAIDGQTIAIEIEKVFKGHIITVGENMIQEARTYALKDFESAVELACAMTMNLDAIITLNPSNFDGATLPIWSVADLDTRAKLESLLSITGKSSDCEHWSEELVGKRIVSYPVIYPGYSICSTARESGSILNGCGGKEARIEKFMEFFNRYGFSCKEPFKLKWDSLTDSLTVYQCIFRESEKRLRLVSYIMSDDRLYQSGTMTYTQF